MAPILDVAGVVAGYGDAEVLHGVSLRVGEGEAVALIGPNGAGKTTLLRVLTGLLRITEGEVLVAGADASGWTPTRFARAGICHVPEGRGVFPGLTVRENLRLFAPRGLSAADAVAQAVEAFPALATLMGRTAGTLSGGQQQMLAVSRATLGSPRLVLIDEASMGLAPIVVDALFDFMARLDCAVVIVEQYVDRVLALTDRVYVLDRGSIALSGRSEEQDRESLMRSYLGVKS